jgi:hypothetical protein
LLHPRFDTLGAVVDVLMALTADMKYHSSIKATRMEAMSSPARKAKQLSAQAVEMPGQRAGGHNEARVVNEWQSTRSGRDTIDQTREGGECM